MSKHLLLNLILIINPINGNKELFNVTLSDPQSQKEFETEKKFYKKFLTGYFQTFEYKKNLSIEDKIKRIKFVEKFYKDHKKTIGIMNLPPLINNIFNIENKNEEITLDTKNNIIKQVTYKNTKTLNELYINKYSSSMANSSLFIESKISPEDSIKNYKKFDDTLEIEKNKLEVIKQTVNINDLIGKSKTSKKKDISVYKKAINQFIKDNNIKKEEKKQILNSYLSLCEILNELYEDYFDYFNNSKENFEIEVEILGKIINYKEKNNNFKDFSFNYIYETIKNICKNSNKENDKYYMYFFSSFQQYIKTEKNINDYKIYIITHVSFAKVLENKNYIQLIKYMQNVENIVVHLREKAYIKTEVINI